MRTNEEQLDLFADLLEPVGEIITDKAVSEKLQAGKMGAAIKAAIKAHKSAVIEMLAALEGVPVDEYVVPGPLGMLKKLLDLLNNPEVKELFIGQGQQNAAASVGSATENTEAADN